MAADLVIRSDGTMFAWLVSQADEPLTVEPDIAPGLALMPLDQTAGSADGDGVITLAPFGVGVHRLVPREQGDEGPTARSLAANAPTAGQPIGER